MKHLFSIVLLALVVMGAADGCEDDGCGDVEACIDEHEAALDLCGANPEDGQPFDWPDDCESATTPDTARDYFCEHTAALMECEDDHDAHGC